MRKPILTVLAAALLLAPASAFAQTAKPAATTTPATMPAATSKSTMTDKMTKGMLVNVNTATSAELTKIPGVSAKIAAEVIKNRPYKDAAELVKKVKGIGPKNVKKMEGMLSF